MKGEPIIAAKAKTSLAIINNEIVEAKYRIHHIIPIVLERDEKVYHVNKRRTYCERIAQL